MKYSTATLATGLTGYVHNDGYVFIPRYSSEMVVE